MFTLLRLSPALSGRASAALTRSGVRTPGLSSLRSLLPLKSEKLFPLLADMGVERRLVFAVLSEMGVQRRLTFAPFSLTPVKMRLNSAAFLEKALKSRLN